MFHQYIRQILRDRSLKSKDLALAIDVTPKHFSQFCNGSANISTKKLWQLICALEELSPGAKRDFCLRLADLSSDRKSLDWNKLIADANLDDLLEVSKSFTKRLGQLKQEYEPKN